MSEAILKIKQEWEERFWSKVNKTEKCWIWLASLRNGYGAFYLGRMDYAHRISYQLSKGEIPVGLFVDHVCNNRRCVNPEHLEVVTNIENIRRYWESQIKCRNGHVYEIEGVYIDPNGLRYCRKCRNLAKARFINKNI